MSQFMTYFLPAIIFFVLFMIGIVVFAAVSNDQYNNGKRPQDQKITKAKIIAVNGITETSHKGLYTRAILGGLVAGERGAFLGALSARREVHTDNRFTFLVYYEGGKTEIENVRQSTGRFKFLIAKLET